MSQSQVADPEGRIPFRIRVGVTGHRQLAGDEHLAGVVRGQLKGIWNKRLRLAERESTPIVIAVVSALAEGADRLVVREALAEGKHRGLEVRLEVILPMGRVAFARDQKFGGESLEEFERLLGKAALVNDLSEAHGEHRYKHVGQAIVNRCDILLALWSGGRTGGEGGSAETLLYAASRWRPCIWIATRGEREVRDNLTAGTAAEFLEDVRRHAALPRKRVEIGVPQEPEPKDVLAPVAGTFDHLRRFNEETLPRIFQDQLDKEFVEARDDPAWIASPYLRATLAASRCRGFFTAATWAMAVLAILAAIALGIGVSFDVGAEAAWSELGLLVALLIFFLAVHFCLKLHERWLSYRLLAERLRSARYLAPTGVNFPRVAGLRGVFVERRSADWLQRAFEEVWDSRPDAGPPQRVDEGDVAELKHRLANEWIQDQIDYHKQAARQHKRREKALGILVSVLFLGTVGAVALHALEKWSDWTTLFSILLPAAAASVGVILTVRQHRAQAERSRRMQAELAEVKIAMCESDPRSLHRVSSEAARVIAEESGDWFGAMWFLDVEHPP